MNDSSAVSDHDRESWSTEDAWRPTIPELITRYCRRWDLTPGHSLTGGSAAHVMTVACADGSSAVLKLSLPHREARHEAAALRWWQGDGAIRLIRSVPDDPYAMLLEPCSPGTRLVDRQDLPAAERLSIACRLLRRLWDHGVPAESPFERLDDVAAEWADQLEQRFVELRPPYDPGLVAEGARLLRELPRSAEQRVLLHGDYNPGNILSAARDPWLVIDPKPMVGDPGYDFCPLILQVDDPFTHPDPLAVLDHRVRLVADLTGVPVDRILAWMQARLVEAALWYANRQEIAPGLTSLESAGEVGRLRR